ncbi:MAG TPA: hypothetical protein VMT17_15875 [Anaeromyxobacteraceae bacterium]|nr:hypothetical protein [Anaeromyxobacteraceae bacterium]
MDGRAGRGPGLIALAGADDALFDRPAAVDPKRTFNPMRAAAKRLRAGGSSPEQRRDHGPARPRCLRGHRGGGGCAHRRLREGARGRAIPADAAPGPTAIDLLSQDETPGEVEVKRSASRRGAPPPWVNKHPRTAFAHRQIAVDSPRRALA